ncbi:MAG: glycoside hydrolase family 38 C-terminal domain-containing protein [Armatimonadota bacterium]
MNRKKPLFRSTVGRALTATFFAGMVSVYGVGAEKAASQTPSPPTQTPGKPVDLTKERVLYVTTYSHLDTEWCWTYRDSIREYIPSTLAQNFALFEQYPNYTFNWTGAIRYQFMKEYYPDEYRRLKKYVAAGRWIPTGSAWEENDAIVPSPESIIRSVLYSNRFFKREFGVTSNQYMMPDTFGFPASLPTILAHCGLKGFSTKKLTYGAGAAAGVPFNIGRWIGIDGQSVVAALNPGDYRTKVTQDLSQSPSWLKRLDENGRQSGVFADYMYHGAGDLGGAPGPESAAWLEKSLAGTGPVRIQARGADDLFSAITPALARRLPAYKGDLLLIQHSAGSINSGAAMKRWNHRNELLADAAERAAVTANLLLPGSYPTERLTDGWLRFIGGQMHDILPGTSIPQAYEFAWNDQILALNQFADVATEGIGTVTDAMNTQSKGIPLVVFNPLSFARQDVVEATISLPGRAGVRVFGPDGKEKPSQIIERDGNNTKIIFLATVPSIGCAVFDVRPAVSPVKAFSQLKVTPETLENARYRVRLNAGGDVASIFDKKAKHEMLSQPVRLAFLQEKPQQHPSWNMDWEDRQKPPVGYVDGPARVSIAENGPVRVALRIEREARGSRFVEIVRLSAGEAGDQVEFLTEVDWRTGECSLKAVFPLTVANREATYNWEVGTVQRGNNDPKKYEVPAHRWFDLTAPDKQYGVSVLTEAKYGSDKPTDDTLRLTLLYTPGVRNSFQHQATQDWGNHSIRYALQGHTGDWRAGNTQSQAARLNQPLLAFQTTSHRGSLGKVFSLLRVSSAQAVVAAVKKAEDSDEVIVRLLEQNGLPARNLRLAFATPILSIREVNGQEQAIPRTGKAILQNGALVFDMAGYRPRAFALKLGTMPARLTSPTRPINQPISLPFDTDVTSTEKGQHDGAFDPDGSTIPGELLPRALRSGGVPFVLGPAGGGAKNAVTCAGQSIVLPQKSSAGKRRIYLVAAAYGGDTPAIFSVDGKPILRTIQDWGGFIGQWHNRVWEGKVPTTGSSWPNALAGITPGYIKRDPVVWYANHKRLNDGTNDAYRFCYLFRYAFDVPPGAKTVTLPNNKRIRILAATVHNAPCTETRPAAPLYTVRGE